MAKVNTKSVLVPAQFKVDPKLREQFKAAAKKRGANSQIIIRKLMAKYVSGEIHYVEGEVEL